jgi:hypothetical protein
VHAVIYCMRGWIAFVAFIELSNAIRFIDAMRRSFSREMFSSPMMRMKKVDTYNAKEHNRQP